MDNEGTAKLPGKPWIGSNTVDSEILKSSTSPYRVEVSKETNFHDDRVNLYETSSIKDFSSKREIGRGRNAVIYTAVHSVTVQKVAIKAYLKKTLSNIELHRIKREIAILRKLSHKYIIKWFGNFEDDICIYLIQEWAPNGDLFEEIRSKHGFMSEMRVVNQVLVPLIFALQYMHKQGVIHRDIKPENILLSKDKIIKARENLMTAKTGVLLANNSLNLKTFQVCDFGLAIDITSERPVSRLGTLQYMAPEVVSRPQIRPRDLTKTGTYDERVDVWACGILVHELMTGRPPFEDTSDTITARKIVHSELENLPECMSQICKDFVRKVLRKNADERLSLDEMLLHPFIKNYFNPTDVVSTQSRNRLSSVVIPACSPHDSNHTPFVSLLTSHSKESKKSNAVHPLDIVEHSLASMNIKQSNNLLASAHAKSEPKAEVKALTLSTEPLTTVSDEVTEPKILKVIDIDSVVDPNLTTFDNVRVETSKYENEIFTPNFSPALPDPKPVKTDSFAAKFNLFEKFVSDKTPINKVLGFFRRISQVRNDSTSFNINTQSCKS